MMEESRIRVPLLDGEYSPVWKIRSRAQMLFLDAVARVAPTTLYSLRDEVLPKYLTAFEVEGKLGASNAEIAKFATHAVVDLLYSQTLPNLKMPRELSTAMSAHRILYDAGGALFEWSKNFNLRGTGYHPELLGDTERPEATLQHRCWPIVVLFRRYCSGGFTQPV
jgi:hypothetical protein